MPEKILVTGGAGFIGFHVSKKLLELGKKVIIVDNFSPYYDVKLKKDRIAQIKKHDGLTVYKADICNFNSIKKILQKTKVDKICHLAAQAGVRYSLKNPFIYEKTNVSGTLNMLELARQFKIKNFIFASSSSVYGANKKIPLSEEDKVESPISVYAATKLATEHLAYTYHHLYGLNCTGLRFFTVYGPWGRPDMSYFKFTKSIINREYLPVYNKGDMKRDFTFVEDAVLGVISALDKVFPFAIFNLGNSYPIELNRFIYLIEAELGIKSKKRLLPLQPGDVKETFADISRARKMLGYKPKIAIGQGIKSFIRWYKDYHGVK